MKPTFLILLLFFLSKVGLLQAQMKFTQNFLAEPEIYKPYGKKFYKYNIGVGFGMDYGGLGGIRFAYLPIKQIAVFAAAGYALIGLGFNAGMFYRIFTEVKACPYIGAMYGYNAVILVSGGPQYDKIYYGPSFCLGFELRSSKLKNYINIELLVPLRPKAYYDDLDALKNNPLINMSNEPPPVGFSLGYHFVF